MTRFHAPISEQIWDMKYRLKQADGTPIDVTVEDTWVRIATALAEAEEPTVTKSGAEVRREHARRFFEVLEDFKFLPAGRITAGAGSGRAVTLFNCYVMGTIPDSMGGIFEMLREAALTMQQGGGIGYDFSTLRPKGALVKGVAADASGPLTFMDCWDAMCRTVMSAGSRRGAMMATMRCDHPDIEAFIEAKKDPLKLRMFNLSVLVTDDFMAAVRDNLTWRLHFEDRHGETLMEKTVEARDLWDKIMRSTYEQAEPGVIFIDRINAANNLNYIETIASTNPCGEQPLPPYGACLLGSVNLVAFVKDAFCDAAWFDMRDLGRTVRTAIRMMDNVVDVSNFPIPQQAEEARAKRRLGLGMTGLADALIMLGITYGSKEAQDFVDRVSQAIQESAYEASVDLAIEKGPFPAFDADGFLAEGTHASTLPKSLKDKIRKHGIRNSHLTSIAPTGTISLYAGNVSSGIEPVFAFHYDRKVLQPDGTKTVERVEDFALQAYRQFCFGSGIDFDPDNLPPQFVSAQTLTPQDHINMQAAAQRRVDSSISKTVNVPQDISFEDFKSVYDMAWKSGCKGCTTYRPNDVTGSILSVVEKPKEAPDWGDDTVFRPAIREALERVSKTRARKVLQKLAVRAFIDLNAVGRARALELLAQDPKEYPIEEFPAELHPAPIRAEATEPPEARPDTLPGAVYKLKWPGGDHSIYVTITDIKDPITGARRPFEVFINSKNMEHYAWTVALTRMISAIFRRPHDSRFVVEELKAVFDPKGGAWMGGKYVPSVLAAIGGLIETHMKSIGYMADPTRDAAVASIQNVLAEQKTAGPVGPSCPVCFSFNVKKESGCFVCKDCGNSNCG